MVPCYIDLTGIALLLFFSVEALFFLVKIACSLFIYQFTFNDKFIFKSSPKVEKKKKASTKIIPKKNQHSTDYPGQCTRLVSGGGGDVGVAVRTLHGHRGLPKTVRKNWHSSGDNGRVVLPCTKTLEFKF